MVLSQTKIENALKQIETLSLKSSESGISEDTCLALFGNSCPEELMEKLKPTDDKDDDEDDDFRSIDAQEINDIFLNRKSLHSNTESTNQEKQDSQERLKINDSGSYHSAIGIPLESKSKQLIPATDNNEKRESKQSQLKSQENIEPKLSNKSEELQKKSSEHINHNSKLELAVDLDELKPISVLEWTSYNNNIGLDDNEESTKILPKSDSVKATKHSSDSVGSDQNIFFEKMKQCPNSSICKQLRSQRNNKHSFNKSLIQCPCCNCDLNNNNNNNNVSVNRQNKDENYSMRIRTFRRDSSQHYHEPSRKRFDQNTQTDHRFPNPNYDELCLPKPPSISCKKLAKIHPLNNNKIEEKNYQQYRNSPRKQNPVKNITGNRCQCLECNKSVREQYAKCSCPCCYARSNNNNNKRYH